MRLSSYVPGVHYLSRRTNIEEGRGAQDLVGRVTGCENERSTFRWRVGMASSLRSRGGGSGRRVFINGIRGIIDGVSRVGQAGVCPRERGKEEMHFPSIHDGPTRRILSISSIDRVVIRVHASRISYLLFSSPPRPPIQDTLARVTPIVFVSEYDRIVYIYLYISPRIFYRIDFFIQRLLSIFYYIVRMLIINYGILSDY